MSIFYELEYWRDGRNILILESLLEYRIYHVVVDVAEELCGLHSIGVGDGKVENSDGVIPHSLLLVVLLKLYVDDLLLHLVLLDGDL